MTIKDHARRAQVDFIQYGESLPRYFRNMDQIDIPPSQPTDTEPQPRRTTALASGLFGYSIADGQMQSFKETEGYLRDIEQMPNFTPPSVSSFVAQYLASNIGRTHSSS